MWRRMRRWKWGWWRVVVGVATLAGWAGCSQPPTAETKDPAGGSTMKLTLSSTAFQAGQTIPAKYTGEGADVSPDLTWSGAPGGTAEFALIVDDPDAPSAEPWVHWVIYKIPAAAAGLKEGIPRAEAVNDPAGALQGKNSWNAVGYRGPLPPPGHGTHHYHFKLYALDQALQVSAGLTKAKLLDATRGHVIAQWELIGTYSR